MARKSWHLDRRTFLMGTGVSLGLPWLECMAKADDSTVRVDQPPRRICALYFGFGVALPAEDHEHAQWRWFPKGEGREFQFTETLKPLEGHREKLTILGGLSHPNGRRMGAHDRRSDTVFIARDVDRRRRGRTDSFQHTFLQRQRSSAACPSSAAADF